MGWCSARLGLAAFACALAQCVSAVALAASTMRYLDAMPTPAKVIAGLQESDAFDLSAKRAGAMYQLRDMVWTLSEGRAVRNQLTPEEIKRTAEYVDSYGKLSNAASTTFHLQTSPERPRWAQLLLHYEVDPALHRELLSRFFDADSRQHLLQLEAAQARSNSLAAPGTPSRTPDAGIDLNTDGIVATIRGYFSMVFIWLLGFIALVFLALGLGSFVKSYNLLNAKLEPVKKSRSGIKIAIDKRCAAVNDLLQLTQHFQANEQLVVLKISQDSTASGMAAAYQQSASVLHNVQNVAERFPNLKSNEHFHRLMDGIQRCEEEIQQHRHYSNQQVENYNTALHTFPRVLVARFCGFSREEYVDLDVSAARGPARAMRVSQSPAADAQLSHVLGLPARPQVAEQAFPATPQPQMLPQHAAAAASGVSARGGGTSVVSALPHVSLRFLSGPLGGRSVPIGAGAIVGREATAAQIVVQDPQVSSAHAWIGMSGNGLIFVDRGSTNGSLVNDVPVRPGDHVPVKSGDVIALGRTKSVAFVVDQA